MSTSGSNALSELKALSKITQDSIHSIEIALAANNLEFPSPYAPFTLESEAARMQPEVAQASALIISAAYQPINSVRSPMLTVTTVATQHALPASLGVAAAANVAEALREAGPKGAHVDEIARASRPFQACPENKHVGTLGIAAAVGHCTDEAMKAAAYLQEALLHPKIAKSQEPNETAFDLAFNTNLPIFEWFEQKGNEHRLLRFGVTTVTTENNAIG